MSVNVQSIVTPVTNGKAPAVSSLKQTKGKLKATTAAAPAVMTAERACEVAYEYGTSLAGLDGGLTLALKTFKDDEAVQEDMLHNLNLGFMVKKMGYDRDEAERVIGLKKYNAKPELQDDEHRTAEQQRVMDNVRLVWHRAQRMAGITKPKTDRQIQAEATRAQKEAERIEHEQRLEQAWEIVNPTNEMSVDAVMARYVATIKNYLNGNADKFIGDSGSAWRDWIAAAPKLVTAKALSKKK